MRLIFFRAWETTIGRRPTGVASLSRFRVLGFVWRVVIFFAAVSITDFLYVQSGLGALLSLWY